MGLRLGDRDGVQQTEVAGLFRHPPAPFLFEATHAPCHGTVIGGNRDHRAAAGYRRRMAVLRLQEVVIDCRDRTTLVEFWARVFGAEAVVRDETWAYVDAPVIRIRIVFQQVTEAKSVKNRVHLDVEVDDIGAGANGSRHSVLACTVRRWKTTRVRSR